MRSSEDLLRLMLFDGQEMAISLYVCKAFPIKSKHSVLFHGAGRPSCMHAASAFVLKPFMSIRAQSLSLTHTPPVCTFLFPLRSSGQGHHPCSFSHATHINTSGRRHVLVGAVRGAQAGSGRGGAEGVHLPPHHQCPHQAAAADHTPGERGGICLYASVYQTVKGACVRCATGLAGGCIELSACMCVDKCAYAYVQKRAGACKCTHA